MRCCKSLLFLVFLLISAVASAQNVTTRISGTVNDASYGETLPGVNVYLSGTTVGIATGADGSYELITGLTGSYELVFSFTGYERRVISIELNPPGDGVDLIQHNVELQPATVLLDELVVEASNKEWKRNYQFFEEQFIGQTDFADQTEVVNSWVMEFEEDPESGRLVSSSAQPLHIVNRALGYEIYVEIDRFEWRRSGFGGFYRAYPRFEEMEPEDDRQRRRWERNREDAYYGSRRHFFRSLYYENLNSNRFYVRPRHFIVPMTTGQVRNALMQQPGTTAAMASVFKGYRLPQEVVVYYGNISFDPTSAVTSRVPGNVKTTRLSPPEEVVTFFIDEQGAILDPTSLMLAGNWAAARMADTLPFNYRPD